MVSISPDSDVLTDSRNIEQQNGLRDSSSMKEFRTLIENVRYVMQSYEKLSRNIENVQFGNYRISGCIQDVAMLKGTNSVICDLGEVFSEKNWEKYRQKSLLNSANIISN